MNERNCQIYYLLNYPLYSIHVSRRTEFTTTLSLYIESGQQARYFCDIKFATSMQDLVLKWLTRQQPAVGIINGCVYVFNNVVLERGSRSLVDLQNSCLVTFSELERKYPANLVLWGKEWRKAIGYDGKLKRAK